MSRRSCVRLEETVETGGRPGPWPKPYVCIRARLAAGPVPTRPYRPVSTSIGTAARPARPRSVCTCMHAYRRIHGYTHACLHACPCRQACAGPCTCLYICLLLRSLPTRDAGLPRSGQVPRKVYMYSSNCPPRSRGGRGLIPVVNRPICIAYVS